MARKAMFISELLFAEKADENFQLVYKRAAFSYS